MGFLMVKGHGVDRELIAGMHRVSKAYFARPFWERMQFKMPPDRYRGYTPLGAESLSYSLDEELPADLKESSSMGPFDHAFDDYHFGPGGGVPSRRTSGPTNPTACGTSGRAIMAPWTALPAA